ncbi:MAG: hypothetical protein Q4G63_08525 [Bacteroidia bacterium]|nr:hypothetical protein [Bacteroidia bacterium]
MTRKEIIERNIGLTFDFVHYIMDNKKEATKLSENFEIEFIDKDFSKIEIKTPNKQNESVIPKKYVRVKNTFEAV